MFIGEPPRAPEDGVPIPWVPDTDAPGLSDLELVADIWAADAREARHAAQRAEAIAALARRRSIERDRDFGPLGGPGLDSRLRRSEVLAQVSETFVSELALIRGCSEVEAETLAIESILLTTLLTGTWDALYAGRIDVRKMRALVDLLSTAKPEVIAEVERRVLPHAGRLTVPQLRARVRRALARLDADALDKRRKEAAKRADVTTRPTGEGMSQLVADLPLHVAAACADAIDQYAQLLRADGDARPIGVIRAAVAADLILRPWDQTRPAVTAQLTIHAPLPSLHDPDGDGGTQPAAEVAGEIVTAAQCRESLAELDLLGIRAAPPGGCVQVAIGNPIDGRLIAVATGSQLRRAAGHRRRTRKRGRPGTAGTAGTAASSRVTPADDRLDTGPGLGPPAPTTAYEPTATQRRFLHVRDRHCRMPGCRRRPGRCDIDHAIAHADGGPTDCWNLCCLCRRHHRIKTFARGWSFTLHPDGQLIVRTPSGVSRTTRPPGWCHDPEPDPPWLDEEAPPDPQRR
ncbi:HNH endonuclease signature motif containing protein [Blastococcus sp. BMG 814]|uniref:HNH endonuclease signature motif containing protein n=2 Tax=Blastococcus carthaginiensis TaxID=3050034 RepID=A0ABT9IDC0_9ACTN|nr:HNH endonuclease signature motif containing protein [Blastococcus carthaginiensis]MDP5183585.1 HNH endonuclease signature motif containing protein [Blastococcus carthaginiensis]